MLRKHKDEIKKKIIVNKSLLTLSLFELDYVISVMGGSVMEFISLLYLLILPTVVFIAYYVLRLFHDHD